MAREKSSQRKHRTEETRLTQNETLGRDRGKSLQDVDTGISSRDAQPVVHVVKKLQELCKAVLVASTKKQQQSGINEPTLSHSSKFNLDYIEDKGNVGDCPLSTDTRIKEIENTPYVGDNVKKANYNLPYSRMLELHNYAEDNEIPSKWIECNKIENRDAHIDEEKPISLEKNVAREKGIAVKDIDVHINNIVNTTISCRTRMMDYLTNISHKADQSSICKNINTTTIKTDSSSSCAIVSDANLKDSNSYKKIAVHDVSRLDHSCKYQNQYRSKNHDNADGYYLRKGCLSKNSVLTAISVKVFDNVKYSEIDYSTDEDVEKYYRKGQFMPTDLQFRMGKRKRIHSSMEDVSDNSLSSNTEEIQPYETSKRVNLNEDTISNDMQRFPCEGVSDLRLVRSFPYSLKSGSNMLPDSITFSDMKSQICNTSAQSPEMFPVHTGIRNELNSDVGIVTRCMEDTSSDVLDCTTRNSSLKSSDNVTDSFSGLYTRKLYEDFRILRSSISVPYPSVSTNPGNRTSQGTRPESENLKCQEEELLRRIEESLAETETLKYQEEELLKRIERSLSETESLKCREEELLKKIERSLTKAESLKFREEELLRRIEVSLAHTETVQSQDEEILKRIEDANCNMGFESKYKPDLDYTLPLKKRKRLKTYDENISLKLETNNTQPESFPSFPSRPMISIAELMAHPMFGMAELERHRMFDSLESYSAASIFPRYNEHDTYDASIYPRDVSVEYLCRNHSMCDRKAENDGFFPVCNKTDDSYREMCNTCAVPKMRNKNYRMPCAEILKEETQSSSSEHWQFNGKYMRNFENLSVGDGDVIEDSKANLNMIVGKSNSEVDNLGLYQKNKGLSTDSCMVSDSKTAVELFERTEMPSGLKHNEVEHTKSKTFLEKNNATYGEFQNCMGFQVNNKITAIDSKHIKIEEESSDSTDSRYIPYRSYYNNVDFISENWKHEEHRVDETKLLKIEVETKDSGE